MIVRFEIDLPDGSTLEEQELDDNLELLAKLESPEGGLVFNNPATGQSTAIGDTLGALIQEFCVKSISPLSAGQEYSVSLFAYPEKVTMKPEGDEVIVTGEEIGTTRYPKKELLEALTACGERYAAYIQKLKK